MAEVAQEYCRRARAVSDLVQEASARAAKGILTAHNDPGAVSHRLDLHGLQVKEAVAVVKQLLDFHRDQKRAGKGLYGGRYITLVTGAGNHSEGGKPRLKPAIERYLRARGLAYTAEDAATLRVSLAALH
jgi:DNA-nicking Smr family endonuclease